MIKTLIEKLKKSELFPENIKSFLIDSIENKKIGAEIIEELNLMLAEEEEAIAKIESKEI